VVRTALLGSAVAVLATAGATVPFLRRVSVLAVTRGTGPGGVPVNRTAAEAGIDAAALGPAYRLTIRYGARQVVLAHEDLLAMTQRTEELPIACVEGWSASGTWGGVRMGDLLALVEAPRGHDVRVTSLQTRYAFGTSLLWANFADDDRTLLALELDGEPLAVDHGYPARVIAPNRPGVRQTKWVHTLEVL
jgi:DMSO/TMAO reductase YedYZ molybdopterin-dependent catalytic subunit